MRNVEELLILIGRFRIDCVIIGGVAAALHGSSFVTQDLDVCYSRELQNLTRIAEALESVQAKLRGAPPGIPFILDSETLSKGLNFTFASAIGPIDFLGEIAGVGTYRDAVQEADRFELFGYTFSVLSLDQLIAAKRATGRVRDKMVLPELEAIRDARAADSDEQDDDAEDKCE
jgi:hypothetical protein